MSNFQIGTDQKARYRLKGTAPKGNVTSSDTTAADLVVDATPEAGCLASGYLWGKKVQSGVVISALVTPESATPVDLKVEIDVIEHHGDKSITVTAAPSDFSFVIGPPEPQDRQQHQLEGSILK